MFKVTKYGALAALLALLCQFVPVYALTLTELQASQGRVLDASTSNYPYPNSSLVSDGGTIYFISGTTKVPFTTWKAFVGLGYSLKYVTKGSLANYTLSSYAIKTSATVHPWDSWVSYKKAIYYITQQGLIGVPSYDVFLSNGGKLSYVVAANKYDLAALKANPNLPILTASDPRVNSVPGLSFNPALNTPGLTNYSTSTFLSVATPNFVPSYMVFGSTQQEIASYTFTAPSNQPVNLTSVTLNIQPNGTASGGYNFVNFNAQANGSAFGPTVAAAAATITFTSATPVVVPAAGSITFAVYADVLIYNGQQLTSLNPATSLASCVGTGVNDSGAIGCTYAYGQNINFLTSTNTTGASALTSSINPAFAGGTVAPGTLAAKIGSYILTASASQGANLNTLTIGTQPNGGPGVLQNLFIQVNGTNFGTSTASVASQGSYTFTGASAVAIAAGQKATVDVYADVPLGSVSVTGLNPATILSGCTGSGMSNASSLTCNLVNGQNISLYTSNTGPSAFPLNVTLNGSFISPYYVFGTQNQQIGSFVITSTSTEAINLNSITVKVQPNGGTPLFQNVTVRTNSAYFAPTQSGIAQSSPITFNGYLSIGAMGTATVDVYADILSGSTVPITVTPAAILFGCGGTGVSDWAKVSCPSLNGQAAAIATSTPPLVPNTFNTSNQ
jgi:hypothetical protein